MADISLIQDDSLDDSDEGVFEQGDGPSGQMDDDSLPPLYRIQKYAFSENAFDRQMVPRVLLELFKSGPVNLFAAELPQIMNIVSKMSLEDETMVRTDLIEQIPNITTTALESASRLPDLTNILGEYLLPMVVRNLGTSDNQVRKTAHSTLFLLMEKGLVNRQQAEIQVCPTVLSLSNMESVMDCHTGAVTLMSRLAPFLGQEVTERVFLQRFSQLCSNHMFYVRKVCASHFGDFCAVIGKEAYEHTLLPCYITLCTDDIWGVRKACAEVVMSVSCACPPLRRRSDLAPVFAKLLQDQSRWVRMSAFQTLGPFISTFADPSITSLAYNSVGELVVVNNNGTEFRLSPTYTDYNMLRSVGELRMLYQLHDRSNIFEEQQKDDDDVIFNPLNYLGIDSNDDADCKEIRIDNIALELDTNTTEEVSLNETSISKENANVEAIEQYENNVLNSNNDLGVDYISILNLQNNNESVNLTEILKNAVLSFGNDSNTADNKNESSANNVIDEIHHNKSCDNLGNLNEPIDNCNDALKKPIERLTENSSCNGDSCTESVGALNNNCLKQNHNCTKLERNKSNDGGESLEEYNSYNYWYISPDMPLDPSIINSELKDQGTSANGSFSSRCSKDNSELIFTTTCSNEQSNTSHSTAYPSFDLTGKTDKCENNQELKNERQEQQQLQQQSLQQKPQPLQQNPQPLQQTPLQNVVEPPQHIVPQLLIDHFVSMTDPNLAQNTDNDMAYHCAYSLPAVALTLGSKNWHLLKDTVEVLAANMQYKVRRTVASSLHELAMILGTDIATNNLTPIFEGFIKDLDEVRIGVLKHLAHFLRLINPSKRNIYLPRLAEFLQTDNEANWRFRQELAEQLLLAVPLFRPGDATKHISTLAQELLCDKVAAVREVALELITELIRHISTDPTLTSRLLINLAEKFAHSKRWKWRQSFALLCSKLLVAEALPPEQFASEVMPHLLDLSWDPVANVRLVVARTISQHIVTNDYFVDVSTQHYDGLQTVLRRLQSDKDRDVRRSAVFQKLTNVQ